MRVETLKKTKAVIAYQQPIDGVYENLEGYNPTKKRRVLIEFDDIIPDMESNKQLSSFITEFFLG